MVYSIIGGILLVVFYLLYVSLIKKRNKVKEAMAGIDVQLKKRYDLIPNLLNMAQKFMEHEKELMTEIVRLRTEAMKKSFDGEPKEMMELDNLIDSKLKDFWLTVENYPDLKSNQTMVQAMQSFNEVEEHIAAARRFYNASVNELKNAVEIFPGNLVAAIVGVKANMPFFEAESAAKVRIDANEFFK
ncbi:MAG: LemA family protein [Alphaproteobacteria bacterium]|nr:LemA family protein [Alphaproteobacteria bacterium]